jgi:hypothetical protein
VSLVIAGQRSRQGPLFCNFGGAGLATTLFGWRTASPCWRYAGRRRSVSTIIRNTIRLKPRLHPRPHDRINQIFFMGGPQLGEVEAGTVAQFFGAPFAILSGGIGCIVAVFFIVRKWPQLLTFRGDEGERASG